MKTNFIDLGLPSGRLWAEQNAVINGKTYFNFDEAVEAFGDMLPSKEAWIELYRQCNWQWDYNHKGYVLTGPNGNTLFLPAKGYKFKTIDDVGHYKDVGRYGHFWSSSPFGNLAWNVSFSSGDVDPADLNNSENGFSVRLCKSK